MAENLHNDDWEKEAPLLASLKGKFTADAPEGYFDSLPDSLMAKIKEKEANEAQQMGGGRNRGWIRWAISAAAAVVLAIGGWWAMRDNTESLPATDMFAEAQTLSSEELIHAVDYVGIATSDIISVMDEEALSAISLTKEAQKDDLNDYLDENPLNDLDFDNLNISDSTLMEYLNI